MKKIILLIIVFFSIQVYGKEEISSPEKTLKEFAENLKKKDWEKVYYAFSKETVQKLETLLKGYMQVIENALKENPNIAKDPKVAKVLSMLKVTGKDFFVQFFNFDTETADKMLKELENYQVIKKEIKGNKAKLTIKTPKSAVDESDAKESNTEETDFLLEDGIWKIDLTEKLKQASKETEKK